MRSLRTLFIVGCHAEGEVGDVIIGDVRDVPGDTMYDKLTHFSNTQDNLRRLLLNEPRGRPSMNTNLLLPPCDPRADMGLLIMGNDQYAFMSGSNTICATTVILETGIVPMQEPETKLSLDTAAGLITVTAHCEAGKCKSVAFDNIPAFATALDLQVDVPGLGVVSVDVAWGGMWYAIVDAASLGLKVQNSDGLQLLELGNKVTRAVQKQYSPAHPENPEMAGVCTVSITDPIEEKSRFKTGKHTVIIPPGRHDRSPCGTGTSARMAVLYARGQLSIGETIKHQSIIGTEFTGHIRGTVKVGNYEAILPTISGRGWITGYKQPVLDPTDPYPEGFRVGDQWSLPAGPAQ